MPVVQPPPSMSSHGTLAARYYLKFGFLRTKVSSSLLTSRFPFLMSRLVNLLAMRECPGSMA